MKLQKLRHMIAEGNNIIITHAVNEITNGGEYTVCGCAIPDSTLAFEGWEQLGDEFVGNIKNCTCGTCTNIINYFRKLK